MTYSVSEFLLLLLCNGYHGFTPLQVSQKTIHTIPEMCGWEVGRGGGRGEVCLYVMAID